MSDTVRRFLLGALLMGCGIFMAPECYAGSMVAAEASLKDTLLVFVGEDLDVLSIASRREESVWKAPAVADVITRQQIRDRGLSTPAAVLNLVPGFHMAQKEGGFVPYLRGIPNSVLFLYDTVPMGSDVTKSIHALGYETSMAAVKRVEVVRGPGSVLWGPDAFAGIVNLVPLTGRDMQGIETGFLYRAPGDHIGGYVNMGHDGGGWDTFLSISGRDGEMDDKTANVIRFWGEDNTLVDPADRLGADSPGDSTYLEAVGRFSYGNWLFVSGRVSDFDNPYVLSVDNGDVSWKERRDEGTGFFKLEAKKELSLDSALRAVGYYAWMAPDFRVIDRTLNLRENALYGEILYDRSVFNNSGLMTGGVSYREKQINNAPIWDGYLPGFLAADEDSQNVAPVLYEADYRTRLWSTFLQLSYKYRKYDFSFGCRYDEHDEYKDHISYNFGIVWTPSTDWMGKLLYGTAYRTPYSRQLLQENRPELENIESVNLQISWKPASAFKLTAVFFNSRIDHHIMEDPYAGLSEPNTQEITGAEFGVSYQPADALNITANFTFLDNRGAQETYRLNDFDFIRPDGTVVEHFVDLAYPFNAGPEKMANLMVTWCPRAWATLFFRLGYFSSQDLIFPRSEAIHGVDGVWQVDAAMTFKDVVSRGVDVEFSVRNLTDTAGELPGTYETIETAPVSAQIEVRKRW